MNIRMENIRTMHNNLKCNNICRESIIRITAVLLIMLLFISGCAGHDSGQDPTTGGTKPASSDADQTVTNTTKDNNNADTRISLVDEELEDANALAAAEAEALLEDSDWVTFLLICNEGMNNTGSNVGNTLMAVSLNSETGIIRLMMLTWDTFVEYEGYDIPQVIDMAYRNGGPEEAVKIFDDNFDAHIDRFMSLNFLNLATLIDDYGGVNVDITRAERNAINGMVASKKRDLQAKAGENMVSQHVMDMMEKEYHLTEFGPDTHLNGLQAVGFGWLQYDSVYNCCEREIKVVAALFKKISDDISEEAVFYTNDTGAPEKGDKRRAINLDDLTEDDRAFLSETLTPIIQTSYNNLSKEEFMDMALAFARTAYKASREGVDIFSNIESAVFPLEAKNPYDIVAGTEGHVIDYEKNSNAMKLFLYKK